MYAQTFKTDTQGRIKILANNTIQPNDPIQVTLQDQRYKQETKVYTIIYGTRKTVYTAIPNIPVNQNVLNIQLNVTPAGVCPPTVVIVRLSNSTKFRNSTMTQIIRNCQGKITQPAVGGKLVYGKSYRYVTKALGYITATGNFTYVNNPQNIKIDMKKRKFWVITLQLLITIW